MELNLLLERMKIEHLLAQLDGVCEHAGALAGSNLIRDPVVASGGGAGT